MITKIKEINSQGLTTLAGGLGLALASSAQAAIVYTDINDIVSTINDNYFFDFDNDLTDDFKITHSSSGGYAYATMSGISAGAQIKTDGNGVTAFNAGDVIGAGSTANFYDSLGWSYDGTPYNNFPGAGDKFVGVEFEIAGDVKYGWLGLNLSLDVGTLTIYDFAYEDSGSSIAAGDKVSVPEPSSMALMATGALAIAALRRRKRKQLLN